MSLAFSHDETISGLATTRATTRRTVADLTFVLAFVALSIVSILVVATQPSSPETERAIAAFAEL